MQSREELVEEEKEAWGSLSFRIDSPARISAAVESSVGVGDYGGDRDEGGDLDFSFVLVPETGPAIAAADVFSVGKIRPVYPVFNRALLFSDRNNNKAKESGGSESKPEANPPIRLPLRRLFIEEEEQSSFSSTSSSISSSSSMDELDGIPAGTYCTWTPPSNKDRRKKSSSAGSTASLRWRLRDLIARRSQSYGKEKSVFIPIQEEKAKAKQ